MLARYKHFLGTLARYEGYFCILTLSIMVIVNIIEIVSRNIFSKSFSGTQELSVLLGSWMIFIGAAYVFSESKLLSVDFLVNRLNGLSKHYFNIGMNMLLTFILLVFLKYGNQLRIIQSVRRTEALHIPASMYVLSLLVSSILMLLVIVFRFMESFTAIKSIKGSTK